MEEQKEISMESPAAKEKIREFCYELALALRRITGKTIENDLAFLDEANQPTKATRNPDSTNANVMDVTNVTRNQRGQDQ